MDDKRKQALIDLSGQIVNGIMSSDGSLLTKLVDRTLHKNMADIVVGIAVDILNRIEKECGE